jgi:tRNA (cytidine/uridine-2'-O-)-methyltransferase
MEIKVALYEPEIAQNVGNIMRTCACFDSELFLIEPFSFLLQERILKRSRLDYEAKSTTFPSFENFMKNVEGRKILFTPNCTLSMYDFQYKKGDILVFGRESNGVETEIAARFDSMVYIPMSLRARSLNLSVSVAIALSYCKNFLVD